VIATRPVPSTPRATSPADDPATGAQRAVHDAGVAAGSNATSSLEPGETPLPSRGTIHGASVPESAHV
jgi:hypothetical protein